MNKSTIISALLLSLGITGSGFLIGYGIQQIRSNRYVSVKGLAERPVTADHGTWQISFVSSGNTFEAAISKNKRDAKALNDFLITAGFTPKEIQLMTPRVNERTHVKKSAATTTSYEIQHSILLKSSNVNLVKNTAAESSKILEQGIILNGWSSPSFYFTNLNEIKPDMIAEATRAARIAAEKFAKDAKNPLGPLRKARQGPFSFSGAVPSISETSQIEKIVRVVINADYELM